jgi:hypothetical protein
MVREFWMFFTWLCLLSRSFLLFFKLGFPYPPEQLLVKKHNGKISVNSVVGQGTEFIIELPIGTAKEEQLP